MNGKQFTIVFAVVLIIGYCLTKIEFAMKYGSLNVMLIITLSIIGLVLGVVYWFIERNKENE